MNQRENASVVLMKVLHSSGENTTNTEKMMSSILLKNSINSVYKKS